MSGGIAYIFDERRNFSALCNREMVSLSEIEDEVEIEFVKTMVFRHLELTESQRAKDIMLNWENTWPLFVRIIPNEYNRVLKAQKQMFERGLSQEEAEMAAFTENVLA